MGAKEGKRKWKLLQSSMLMHARWNEMKCIFTSPEMYCQGMMAQTPGEKLLPRERDSRLSRGGSRVEVARCCREI